MNYFKLLSACPVAYSNDYIDQWVDSISTIVGAIGTAHTRRYEPAPDDKPSQDGEPLTKRRRPSASKPCDRPFYLPNTPSPTNSHRESPMPRGTSGSSRGRKRPGDDGADSTDPEANTQFLLHTTPLRPIAIPRPTP
ncbi:hypothetical protein CIB48_g12232 [Xylaria polymorpha]|nr:hypothetical protein CIB48_g12232 [Xylaria polymorpha]